MFAALTYRLLRGLPSIYARHGYAPDLSRYPGDDPEEAYRADLAALRGATARVWPAVASLARARGRRAAALPAAPPARALGACLARLPCAARAAALNDLGFLSARVGDAEARGAEEAGALALLRAHRRVLLAHRRMARAAPATGLQEE